MVVRVDYKDNDLQSNLENFFKQFRFKNYYAYSHDLQVEDDLEKWKVTRVEMEDLFEEVIYKSDSISDENVLKFSEYVRKSILSYLRDLVSNETFEYLDKNISVSVLSTFSEKWENDEVIYYFTNADKFIVQ